MAASERVVERRRVFQQYKEDVKERGKPFYPYAMFHDTVMSLVVVGVIIALACVWYFTAQHADDHVGLLGPLVTYKADPGTTSFVPRPDWFFYFLFYLLRIFKWPDSVILGTIGIPTRRVGSASSTTSRPTRARSASSRGRTGTSTSSSICCGSSRTRTRSSSAPSAFRRSR